MENAIGKSIKNKIFLYGMSMALVAGMIGALAVLYDAGRFSSYNALAGGVMLALGFAGIMKFGNDLDKLDFSTAGVKHGR